MKLKSSFSVGRKSRGKGEDLKVSFWGRGLTAGRDGRDTGKWKSQNLALPGQFMGLPGAWRKEDSDTNASSEGKIL